MRFVVDETAFDCDDLEAETVRDSFLRFAALLRSIRLVDAEPIGVLSGWGALPCWRGDDLATLLNSDVLGRDERLLVLGLLDKCVDIDDDADSLDPSVSVGGHCFESYGIALAHSRLAADEPCAMAVLALAHNGRLGACAVRCGEVIEAVFFIVDFEDERLFWRAVYDVEDVPEGSFFDLAARAFPKLVFAESLTFRQFEGQYRDLRGEVVRHLGAINDGWSTSYVEAAGNAEVISTRLGIEVSRESSRTRASERLMRSRDIPFEGEVYRCEWHSKLEPHRNRIHFYGEENRVDRPLIGIFCEHLATEG